MRSDFYVPTAISSDSDELWAEDEEEDEFDAQLSNITDDAEEDREDGKPWEFETGEDVSKDKLYVFCPAPHRKQILLIFAKHFCQHPIFLERLETAPVSSREIRDRAVWEMYSFCKQRGLREVWGYLWANWYSPQRWVLWARSSSPDILTISRTTMGTENFWRQLKHNFLHNVNRPRIDNLVYIILNKVSPAYYARMVALEHSGVKSSAIAFNPSTPIESFSTLSWGPSHQGAPTRPSATQPPVTSQISAQFHTTLGLTARTLQRRRGRRNGLGVKWWLTQTQRRRWMGPGMWSCQQITRSLRILGEKPMHLPVC